MLSSLPFASFLAYSPHGQSAAEQAATTICREIKRDGYVRRKHGEERIIPYAVRRLRECLTAGLADFLAADVVLVPAPGSAPLLPRQPNAPWISRRICEELRAAGFGCRMDALLLRRQAVAKSAFARRGARPGVQEHYDSFEVAPRLGEPPARITLIDDVITRGATLLAGASRLAEAFPDATVRAFALVRTQYPIDRERDRQRFRAIIDPITARVTHNSYGAWRRDP
ncbi:MAG TPA: phosphoribosyltransferase [Thermoanaerobaculia bacterium]|nr:phosphoribosyltransferase [Thermoanaerobaculia bacterium]